MSGQRKFKISNFVSVFAAIAFLFMSVAESIASCHHEVSCAENSKVSFAGESHSNDCKDLPSGHEHESNPCADVCHLGHCHSSHGNLWAQNGVFSQHLSAGSDLKHSSQIQWIYRNPYLGKPLQPPRS